METRAERFQNLPLRPQPVGWEEFRLPSRPPLTPPWLGGAGVPSHSSPQVWERVVSLLMRGFRVRIDEKVVQNVLTVLRPYSEDGSGPGIQKEGL